MDKLPGNLIPLPLTSYGRGNYPNPCETDADDTESLYSSGTASVSLPPMSSCSSPAFRVDSASGSSLRMEGGQSKYELMDDAEKQLKCILGSIKSVSAKEDFIRSLRYKKDKLVPAYLHLN